MNVNVRLLFMVGCKIVDFHHIINEMHNQQCSCPTVICSLFCTVDSFYVVYFQILDDLMNIQRAVAVM